MKNVKMDWIVFYAVRDMPKIEVV